MKKIKTQNPRFHYLKEFLENKLCLIIFILFFICLVWRIIYFIEIQSSPYGTHLAMDSLYHDQWAREIASGKFIGNEVFFRAPLYPYFMGCIYFLCNGNQVVIKLIQMLLGTLSCFFIYLITKKIFNTLTALIAFSLSAIYNMFIYFENELLIVSLIIFLDLIALFFLLKAKETEKWYYFAYTGLILGLSAIARPNILLFVIIIPVWMILTMRKKVKPHKIILFCVTGFFCVMVPIIPVMVYNYTVGKDVVPIASQGGVNFYIGNNKYADGRTAIVPGTRESWWGGYEDQISIAKKALNDPDAKPSEISGYWFSQGVRYIIDDFPGFLLLTLKKIYMFWNAYEIGNNRDINFITRHFILFNYFTIKFWFIGPLAIAGFFLSIKKNKDITLLLFFIISYAISVIVFFVNARYRMPVIPLLITGAAYTLYKFTEILLQKNGIKKLIRNKTMAASCIIIVTGALFMGPFFMGRDNPAQNYFHEAQAYESKGDIPGAINALHRALTINPGFVKGYVNLGVLYLVHTKEYKKAVNFFEKALSVSPGNLKALFNIGLAYNASGDTEKAKDAFLNTIHQQPEKIHNTEAHLIISRAHTELGIIYESEKNYIRALSEFKEAIALNPSSFIAWTRAGRMYIILKQRVLAEKALNQALLLNPDFTPAKTLLDYIK